MEAGHHKFSSRPVIMARLIILKKEFTSKSGVRRLNYTEDPSNADKFSVGAIGSAKAVTKALDLVRAEAVSRGINPELQALKQDMEEVKQKLLELKTDLVEKHKKIKMLEGKVQSLISPVDFPAAIKDSSGGWSLELEDVIQGRPVYRKKTK